MIDVSGGPQPGQRSVRCPGNPVCPRIAKLTKDDFAPVPRDVGCIQIYGGDATAHVSGHLRATPIDASFALNNGCEISRWEHLRWLLGPSGAPPS